MPGQPITAPCTWVGGGLTLPRYVAATRPGSRQQVLELEPGIVDLVRRELPLPRAGRRPASATATRETLGRLPSGLAWRGDLIVVDIFGSRIPAHVTSVEFYTLAASYLALEGIMRARQRRRRRGRRVREGPDRDRRVGARERRGARRPAGAQGAPVRQLRDRRVARGASLDWMPRLLAGGPHPAAVVAGRELRDWIAGAPLVHDAEAVDSPPPSRSVFQAWRRRRLASRHAQPLALIAFTGARRSCCPRMAPPPFPGADDAADRPNLGRRGQPAGDLFDVITGLDAPWSISIPP
ncbi:MAG: spermine synthase [Schumannella sp.]